MAAQTLVNISTCFALFLAIVLIIRYGGNRLLGDLQTTADRVNGKINYDSKRVQKYFQWLSPPDVKLLGRYSDLNFTVTVRDHHQQNVALNRPITIVLESDSILMSFRIFRKTPFFTLSSSDTPIIMSKKNSGQVFLIPKASKGFHNGENLIELNRKKYFFESDEVNVIKFKELIKRPTFSQNIDVLLKTFKAIEVNGNQILMVKEWAKQDTAPERLLRILESGGAIAKELKL